MVTSCDDFIDVMPVTYLLLEMVLKNVMLDGIDECSIVSVSFTIAIFWIDFVTNTNLIDRWYQSQNNRNTELPNNTYSNL